MIVKFLRRVWHRRNVYNSRTKSPASILRFTCWNFIGYFYEFHFIIERRATCNVHASTEKFDESGCNHFGRLEFSPTAEKIGRLFFSIKIKRKRTEQKGNFFGCFPLVEQLTRSRCSTMLPPLSVARCADSIRSVDIACRENNGKTFTLTVLHYPSNSVLGRWTGSLINPALLIRGIFNTVGRNDQIFLFTIIKIIKIIKIETEIMNIVQSYNEYNLVILVLREYSGF